MKPRNPLADLWQRELDGIGRKSMALELVHGDEARAVEQAIRFGMSPEAILAALATSRRRR